MLHIRHRQTRNTFNDRRFDTCTDKIQIDRCEALHTDPVLLPLIWWRKNDTARKHEAFKLRGWNDDTAKLVQCRSNFKTAEDFPCFPKWIPCKSPKAHQLTAILFGSCRDQITSNCQVNQNLFDNHIRRQIAKWFIFRNLLDLLKLSSFPRHVKLFDHNIEISTTKKKWFGIERKKKRYEMNSTLRIAICFYMFSTIELTKWWFGWIGRIFTGDKKFFV